MMIYEKIIFIICHILLYLNIISVSSSTLTTCEEKPNQLLFMKRCWCEPGWETFNKLSIGYLILNCTVPVLKIDDCECEIAKVNDRSFLKNNTWQHPKGLRCTNICRSNSQVGVPRADVSEWKDNQGWRQLPFYQKDLPKKGGSHLIERLNEFADAFDRWKYLKGMNLGKVIEFGAGGYTQLRNIMENVNVTVEEVTLLDPQIYKYKPITGCTYFSGNFTVNDKAYPTTLSNLTIEQFGKINTEKYDTVVVMNVLVYSLNAFDFLETVHKSLKKGGLLIFHDRWFDNIPISSKCKFVGFFMNVVEVSKELLDHFLSFYDKSSLFFSTNQTSGQIMRSKNWCHWLDDENAFYVAVKKIRD